jgi:hypothetical protein
VSVSVGKVQNKLVSMVDEAQFNSLIADLDVKDVSNACACRVARCAAPGACAWLEVLPLEPVLSLSNGEFRSALRLMLGVSPSDDRLTCHCGAPLVGGHYQQCTEVRYTVRHNRVVDEIASIGRFVNMSVQREPSVKLRPPGDAECPAVQPDVVLGTIASAFSRRLAVDVAIVHPERKSVLKIAADRASMSLKGRISAMANELDQAVREEENVKRNSKHKGVGLSASEVCDLNGLDFEPFVAETHGFLGDAATAVIGRVAEHAFNVMRFDRRLLNRYISRRIAIAIQRGNALLDATYLSFPSAEAYQQRWQHDAMSGSLPIGSMLALSQGRRRR